MKSVTMVITGRVQGVFFRTSAKDHADRLGVKGWIKNESNGCVTAHVEGDDAAVEKFIAWCGHGPDAAKVEHVEMSDAPFESAEGFSALE